MNLELTPDQATFRDELRLWLAKHSPGPGPVRDEDAYFEFRREWQRELHRGRWAAVHWPVEFGGRAATVTESAIFFEELGRSNAPLPANILGLLLAGPTLMSWGSPEQRERYLPTILSGDEVWCQGFSEPEAGSDLAAVKTTAVREGDNWVISGQKVWTSLAQYARCCMLVARTDPEAAKHKGLTYFILDMEADGVSIRPLRQITGEFEFNELFLDEVRIPHSNVVGGVGNGWKVALTTLMNERAGLAFFQQVGTRRLLQRLVADLSRHGLTEDSAAVKRLGELHARLEVLRITSYRGLGAIERHGVPGPEGSLTKLMWARANQEVTESAVQSLAAVGLERDSDWAFEMLRARGNTIEGGTTEILKNIVAERILGLPKGR